jgi:transcriptional regulator with XRE-family HTH domain
LAKGKEARQAQRARWDRAIVAIWAASRRDSDLTQEQLAEKLGWTRNMVASVEAGRREVTATELIMFAAVVGVDPRTLLERILRW